MNKDYIVCDSLHLYPVLPQRNSSISMRVRAFSLSRSLQKTYIKLAHNVHFIHFFFLFSKSKCGLKVQFVGFREIYCIYRNGIHD